MPPRSELTEASPYRWVIVAAAAVILAMVMGQLVNGLSVFFIPLEREFGWDRGSIALINTIGLAGISIGGIVMGFVADRTRIRTICVIAALAVGLCVGAAAWADQLWQFYLLFLLAGLFGGGAAFAPVVAVVGNWFPTSAGLAIGIASAGQAVGQGGVPFVSAWLIEGLGWRGAFLALGAGTLAILLPLAALMREPPQRDAGPGAAASAEPPPLVDPLIVTAWLGFAVFLCCTCMAVPLMHLVPLIQGRGISAPDAGAVIFLMLIVAIAGRVAFGRLADMIGAIPAYMTASLWQTVGVFAFTRIETLGGFYAFAPLYGFGYAGVMTGVLVTARSLTPPARRASLMGIIMSFAWIGHGAGGWQAGWFYDLSGGYTIGFANAAAAGALNLIVVGSLFLLLRRRRLAVAA